MAIPSKKLPKYTGPRHYTPAQKYAYRVMRAVLPQAYITSGIGWCGPGWETAEARNREIDEGHLDTDLGTALEKQAATLVEAS